MQGEELAPRWYAQLVWSPARSTDEIISGNIPAGAGLYAFTRDRGILTPENTLYVGKADGGRQTLRSRLRTYLSYFKNPQKPASNHAGKKDLVEYYKASPGSLFVRWTGVIVARELEGTLIDMLDPPFNHKDEHRFGFADDEEIPADMLYEV